jgi:hypothetical protein
LILAILVTTLSTGSADHVWIESENLADMPPQVSLGNWGKPHVGSGYLLMMNIAKKEALTSPDEGTPMKF